MRNAFQVSEQKLLRNVSWSKAGNLNIRHEAISVDGELHGT